MVNLILSVSPSFPSLGPRLPEAILILALQCWAILVLALNKLEAGGMFHPLTLGSRTSLITVPTIRDDGNKGILFLLQI